MAIKRAPHVLYLTFDGLLEPLGHSQVTSLVELMTQDFAFSILSLEKPEDLEDRSRLRNLKTRLAAHGIEWRFDTFRSGVRGALRNLTSLSELAFDLATRTRIDLTHARSYQPATVAWFLKQADDTPYLFDFRGFWVDEKIDADQWFNSRTDRFLARRWERTLFRRADAIVSLAEPGADDIRRGRFGRLDCASAVHVIPTCVDMSRFSINVSSEIRQRLGLEGKLVIGFVGSINPSYRVQESLALFKIIRQANENAILLAITRQVSAFHTAVEEAGIESTAVVVESVPHEEVHRWIGAMDWGLLLLTTSKTKRASMPTKLGEFFAAGVRPIHHGCNADVTAWVRRTGSGISLDDTSSESLMRAARKVVAQDSNEVDLIRAREIASSHFGLRAGARAYSEIYRRTLVRTAHQRKLT